MSDNQKAIFCIFADCCRRCLPTLIRVFFRSFDFGLQNRLTPFRMVNQTETTTTKLGKKILFSFVNTHTHTDKTPSVTSHMCVMVCKSTFHPMHYILWPLHPEVCSLLFLYSFSLRSVPFSFLPLLYCGVHGHHIMCVKFVNLRQNSLRYCSTAF